jgi:hypothetical protein
MFIVPRTPLSPKRMNITSNVINVDIYERFSEILFSVDPRVRSVLIKKVIDYVGHPAYTHLFQTMDKDNVHHIMGYLRSQRCIELYFIIDQVCKSPLPTKSDFYQSLAGL